MDTDPSIPASLPPDVSVLMPVFNAAAYVGAAIASILAQDLASLELVLLDDGSTDGSSRVLHDWAERDTRVRLLVQENRGLIPARNRLLEEARAEYCAWMDADDIAYPQRLSRQLSLLRAQPDLVAVGAWAIRIDASGATIGTERRPESHDAIRADQLSSGGGMRFPTVTMRISVARAVGGFRSPFLMGEDLDLLLRMGERGRLLNVQEPLLYYRVHGASTTAAQAARWSSFRQTILALAEERQRGGPDRLQRGETVEIAPAAAGSAADFMAAVALRQGRRALAECRWADARRHAWRAMRQSPTRLDAWRVLARACLKLAPRP